MPINFNDNNEDFDFENEIDDEGITIKVGQRKDGKKGENRKQDGDVNEDGGDEDGGDVNEDGDEDGGDEEGGDEEGGDEEGGDEEGGDEEGGDEEGGDEEGGDEEGGDEEGGDEEGGDEEGEDEEGEDEEGEDEEGEDEEGEDEEGEDEDGEDKEDEDKEDEDEDGEDKEDKDKEDEDEDEDGKDEPEEDENSYEVLSLQFKDKYLENKNDFYSFLYAAQLSPFVEFLRDFEFTEFFNQNYRIDLETWWNSSAKDYEREDKIYELKELDELCFKSLIMTFRNFSEYFTEEKSVEEFMYERYAFIKNLPYYGTAFAHNGSFGILKANISKQQFIVYADNFNSFEINYGLMTFNNATKKLTIDYKFISPYDSKFKILMETKFLCADLEESMKIKDSIGNDKKLTFPLQNICLAMKGSTLMMKKLLDIK